MREVWSRVWLISRVGCLQQNSGTEYGIYGRFLQKKGGRS